MKRFWKKIGTERVFSVISIADDFIRGGRFHLRGKKWHLSAFAEAAVAENKEEAFREVARKVASADYCAVAGAAESVFFRFESSDLPDVAQRGAVEFELPRRVIRMPEKSVFQFMPDPAVREDGSVGVNVTVFPQPTLDGIVGLLKNCGNVADDFIYPFMAVSDELPQLYLPEIEADFYFDNGQWMPVPADPAERENLTAKALEAARKWFVLSDVKDFEAEKNLPLLMCAGVVASGGVSAVSSSLRVLPENVRPVRFRQHVILTVLLAVLLLVNLGWYFYRTKGKTIRDHRRMITETKRLKAKASEMTSAVKRGRKENKEISRIVEMGYGNRDVVAEFAMISEKLPKDVMVSSMRWNDDAIDMILVCENDKIDLPSLIQPLNRWRIAQLQQRQGNESVVATINLKLVQIRDGKGEK